MVPQEDDEAVYHPNQKDECPVANASVPKVPRLVDIRIVRALQ